MFTKSRQKRSAVLSGRIILFGIGQDLNHGNGDVNTVYFINGPGEIVESVARSLFTMNEHAIANVYLYLSFLLRHCKLM